MNKTIILIVGGFSLATAIHEALKENPNVVIVTAADSVPRLAGVESISPLPLPANGDFAAVQNTCCEATPEQRDSEGQPQGQPRAHTHAASQVITPFWNVVRGEPECTVGGRRVIIKKSHTF
jgi:hypothetical protein